MSKVTFSLDSLPMQHEAECGCLIEVKWSQDHDRVVIAEFVSQCIKHRKIPIGLAVYRNLVVKMPTNIHTLLSTA